jgi:hypothetical protein
MVAEGLSANEIQARLEARVGGNLSGIPNREASYALPVGLATGAALVLFFVFMRLRGRHKEEVAPAASTKGAASISETTPLPTVDDQRLADEMDVED